MDHVKPEIPGSRFALKSYHNLFNERDKIADVQAQFMRGFRDEPNPLVTTTLLREREKE